MDPSSDLKTFLQPYDKEIQKLAFALRELILQWTPEANELIWDGYNAVSIAFSKSFKLGDAFCHIAVYKGHINLGFNRGTELTDESNTLKGTGRLIRHIKIEDMAGFSEVETKKMILEAVKISELRNPKLKDKASKGESRVMSVSQKKIRPDNI